MVGQSIEGPRKPIVPTLNSAWVWLGTHAGSAKARKQTNVERPPVFPPRIPSPELHTSAQGQDWRDLVISPHKPESLYRRLWCSRGKNSLIADSVEKRVVLRTFNWSVVLGSLCLELESAKRSRLLISDWQVKFWPKCSPHCGWIWHIFNLTALSWTKFLLLVRCKMSPDFCPEYTSGVTSNYRDA